jgi:hypothetical protein
METSMPAHTDAIRRFAAGGPMLANEIEGLSREDLLAFPVPGTWSIQQIVIHIVDSDLVGCERMKRVIAEDVPLLVNADENAWTSRLTPEALDVHQAAQLFALNRAYVASMLSQQPEAAFSRYGIHTRAGKKTLLDLVTGFADHLEGHLVHLRNKRKMLGK